MSHTESPVKPGACGTSIPFPRGMVVSVGYPGGVGMLSQPPREDLRLPCTLTGENRPTEAPDLLQLTERVRSLSGSSICYNHHQQQQEIPNSKLIAFHVPGAVRSTWSTLSQLIFLQFFWGTTLCKRGNPSSGPSSGPRQDSFDHRLWKQHCRSLSGPALLPWPSCDIPSTCHGEGESVSCKSANMASFHSYLNYMLLNALPHDDMTNGMFTCSSNWPHVYRLCDVTCKTKLQQGTKVTNGMLAWTAHFLALIGVYLGVNWLWVKNHS